MAAARFDPATLVVLRPGKRCKLVRGALIGTYGLPGVSSMESGQCRIKGLLLVHKHFRTLEIDGRTWFDRGPETNKAWLRLMLQRRAFRNFTKALLPYVNTAALTAGVAAGDSLACSLHAQLTSGGWAAAAAAPLTPQIYEEGSAASLEARLAQEYPGASPQLLSFILTQEGGGEREPAGDGYSDSEEEEEGGSSPEGGGYDALSEPSRLEPHLRRSAAIFARLGMRPQVGSALHEFGRNGKAWMQLTGTGIWGSAFPGHASVDSMRAVLARMEAEGVRWGPALTEAVEALAVAAEADAARGEWRPVRLQLGGLHVFCRSGAPSQADLDRLEAAAPREQRKASALVVEHAFSQYLVDPEAPPGSDEARFNVLPRMTACPECFNSPKNAGVFVVLPQLLRRFPHLEEQLPSDWLAAQRAAGALGEWMVHVGAGGKATIITRQQWVELKPLEVFFDSLAQEQQERWQQQGRGPLWLPCSQRHEADRCERCRPGHAARSETIVAQTATEVALQLRIQFAGPNPTLAALGKLGPTARPIADGDRPLPRQHCSAASACSRFAFGLSRAGQAVAEAAAAPQMMEDRRADEEAGEQLAAEEPDDGAAAAAGPVQLDALALVAVGAASAVLAEHGCAPEHPRHAEALRRLTLMALCSLWRRWQRMSRRRQRSLVRMIAEHVARLVGAAAGEEERLVGAEQGEEQLEQEEEQLEEEEEQLGGEQQAPAATYEQLQRSRWLDEVAWLALPHMPSHAPRGRGGPVNAMHVLSAGRYLGHPHVGPALRLELRRRQERARLLDQRRRRGG